MHNSIENLISIENELKSSLESSKKVNIIHEAIDSEDDFITSRIMWLSGLNEGFNKGGNVDSYNRFISSNA